MPDHRTMPDERRTRDRMLQRIDALERRLAGRSQVPIFESHSLGGIIYPSVSGCYYPPRGGRLVSLITSLATGGEDPTVIDVYRGSVGTGVLLETITLAADQVYEPRNCAHYIDSSQFLQWEITTAGTGAKSLVVQTEIIPGR